MSIGEYNVTKVLMSRKLKGLDLRKELFKRIFAKNYDFRKIHIALFCAFLCESGIYHFMIYSYQVFVKGRSPRGAQAVLANMLKNDPHTEILRFEILR